MKTWKVLRWDDEPEDKTTINLGCPHCGTDAEMPIRANCGMTVIASMGLSLVFDAPSKIPPENYLPNEVKCRYCRRIFTDKEP